MRECVSQSVVFGVAERAGEEEGEAVEEGKIEVINGNGAVPAVVIGWSLSEVLA